MPLELFTIGHSTHPLDRFLALLAQHHIKLVADIRRFPGSRKFPHFNRDSLATALPQAGVEYRYEIHPGLHWSPYWVPAVTAELWKSAERVVLPMAPVG